MLEIRDIQYFPDGRAVVDTVGGRRFKVLRRGVRDGYHTAAVEFVKDSKLDSDSLQGEKEKNGKMKKGIPGNVQLSFFFSSILIKLACTQFVIHDATHEKDVLALVVCEDSVGCCDRYRRC